MSWQGLCLYEVAHSQTIYWCAGENIVALLPQVNAVESLAIVLPIFLYCCFLRSLRKLLPVSFLANIAILLGYFLVMDQAIKRLVEHGVDSTAMKPTVRTDTLPLFFGLVTSSYEGIGLILPVEGATWRPPGLSCVWSPAHPLYLVHRFHPQGS